MKEKLLQFKDKTLSFWRDRTKGQKGIFIGSLIIVIGLIAGIMILVKSHSNMVPLFNDLSTDEASQVTSELDSKNEKYELKDGGKAIEVPEDRADKLLVDLAGEGIPKSGNVDYSFFSDNASWGTTDDEFDMIKLDAMQTELANLIKNIDGINDANVMINLPKDPVFLSDDDDDDDQQASASVVINTKPGQKFKGNQIETLYNLVSKAVPNLSEDNIAIMNQYFEYFDKDDKQPGGSHDQDSYAYQESVKKDVERDIRKRVQQMLGAMVGPENVVVSVTADVDFKKETRKEELVDPVDVDNMEGVPVSIKTVRETYGGGKPAGGEAGTGEGDVPGYEADDDDGDGDYELVKKTVNNEYNRIHKDIAESPYKLRNLGVQIAVNDEKNSDGKNPETLSTQEQNKVEDGISSILNSIVSTSVDKDYVDDVDPEDNTSIVFQKFNGKQDFKQKQPTSAGIPLWLYITGGLLLLIVIFLIIFMFKRRQTEDVVVEEELSEPTQEPDVPDIDQHSDDEAVARRKQLEKMAKDKPEDFAKLLRSWLSDD